MAQGLTLIELLAALCILGVLSAIAVPIYVQYSLRSLEAQAHADLLRCAAGMERHAAQRFTYAGAGEGGADSGAPGEHICRPQSAAYELRIRRADATGFELVAEPRPGTAVAGREALMIDAAGHPSVR